MKRWYGISTVHGLMMTVNLFVSVSPSNQYLRADINQYGNGKLILITSGFLIDTLT